MKPGGWRRFGLTQRAGVRINIRLPVPPRRRASP
jgi:hypothetical protein